MLEEHPDRFLERCFTPDEQRYAAEHPKRRIEHLAARFAAKEAVLKAIGTGLSRGIAWTDVEVTRDPSGAPGVRLRGQALQIATERGITRWILSLSHTEEAAMASAIGLASE